MRRRYPTQRRSAVSGRWLRRGARSWAGVVAVAVACSLLASSARAAAPAAGLARESAAGPVLHADAPTPLAQLEARAAELSRRYRGQLEMLTGAETAAEAAAARVLQLDRQLARLAAASYMGSAPDQVLAVFAGGDPQQVLGRAAAVEYLARHVAQALGRLQNGLPGSDDGRAGGMSERDEFAAALEQQRRASDAMFCGDPEPYMSM